MSAKHHKRSQTNLTVLLLFMSFGFIVVLGVGYHNTNSMKINLDKLYFGSLIPVMELNDIIHAYQDDIESPLSEVRYTLIDATQAEERILSAQNIIQEKWKSYASHYKHESEKAYLSYVNKEIQDSLKLIDTIAGLLEQEGMERISMRKIHAHINHIESIIEKLIAYEMDVAHYERQSMLDTYDNMKMLISLTMVITLFFVASVTINTFKELQTHSDILELATSQLKQLNAKLESASYTDELTTLYNRRFFNLIYERELKRAKREKNGLGFMMIDIDHFKLYNDTYGHLEGDKVLKEVALALKAKLNRPGDYLFRLGGEEFGVLLCEAEAKSCEYMANELCLAVESLGIEHAHNSASNVVTISVGAIFCIPSLETTEQSLISKADENLYVAKEEGRNQVLFEIIA